MPWSRKLPLIILLLGLLHPLWSQSGIPFSSFFPCDEGSLEEYRLLTYLEEEFTLRDIDTRILTYGDKEELHSFSRSLELYYPGKSEERIYIALSLNGSASRSPLNVQILYDLALSLAEKPPETGVSLLFLGGERNTRPIGSTDFLEEFTREETSTLIYLDLAESGVQLISGTTGHIAPLWFVRDFCAGLEKGGLRFHLDGMGNLLSRTGLELDPTPLSPWLEKDIPALLLTDGGGGFTDDGEETLRRKIVKGLIEFISAYQGDTTDNQEKNYLILSFLDDYSFIEEFSSIIIMLIFLSVFILTVVFQSRNFTLNLRKNSQYFWVLLLSYSLVFTFLYLATLMMEEMHLLKDMNDLWLLLPRSVLFFKLLFTLLATTYFLMIIRGLPIPRTPHFYSYGAIFFSLVNMLLLAGMDISLIYYALWLFLCLFPFVFIRRIMYKTVITFIMPIPMLLILTTMLINNYPGLTHLILMDRIRGNLIITAFLMPFILMITSLHYSRFYYHRERQSYTLIVLMIAAPLALGGVITNMVLFQPFTSEENQPFHLSDKTDYAADRRTITLTSPRTMGAVELTYNGSDLTLNSLGEEASINARPDRSLLSYSGEISTFLGRKRIQLEITPAGHPESIEITLRSQDEIITIYDCNFPYESTIDNRESRIIIGKNPRIPLSLDLTLTAASQPVMTILINYDSPPVESPVIGNKPVTMTHSLSLQHELDLTLSQAALSFPEQTSIDIGSF